MVCNLDPRARASNSKTAIRWNFSLVASFLIIAEGHTKGARGVGNVKLGPIHGLGGAWTTSEMADLSQISTVTWK